MRDGADIALPGLKARLARRRASPDRPPGGRSCIGSPRTTVGCDLTMNRHRKTVGRPPAVGRCPARMVGRDFHRIFTKWRPGVAGADKVLAL